MSAQRFFKFAGLLVASWVVMTTVHECGHILCGLTCGGHLVSADLWPWHLPHSMFEPDPQPLVTLWGGPILGAAAPLAFAWFVNANWGWFIAYFCLLANGAYVATAWVAGDRYLDTTRLLEHGAHPLSIAIYCLATIGFGYIGFRKQCVQMLGRTQFTNQ